MQLGIPVVQFSLRYVFLTYHAVVFHVCFTWLFGFACIRSGTCSSPDESSRINGLLTSLPRQLWLHIVLPQWRQWAEVQRSRLG
jgi:hypothetical protein